MRAPTARTTKTAITAAAAAAVLAGCGVTNPYQTHPTTTTPPRTTAAAAASSTSSSLASSSSASAAGTGDAGAVTMLWRYTTLSIDWTSTTLAANQRRLAQIATGGARAQALQTAATYGAHSTLARSHVANHGQITSIAPGQGPRQGQWVITTQETTTGRGDYTGLPAEAHVYYAQLTPTTHGTAVSQWSPQN